MLIPVDTLNTKYEMKVGGILHIGAHEAEERESYNCFANASELPMYWIEANVDIAGRLTESLAAFPNQHVIVAVAGEKTGEVVKFSIANNGQSSSILELGTHKTAHPEVHYVDSESRYTTSLEDVIRWCEIPEAVNFINLDIQGAELLALKGLGPCLEMFDYIYTEINVERLYEDCALLEEIDEFLTDYERVETDIIESFGWGDAFYVKKGLL